LEEHRLVKGYVEALSRSLFRLEQANHIGERDSGLPELEGLLRHLKEYEKHKVREENSLFPYLEKHGVTGPPAMMWTEHDAQRAEIKGATDVLGNQESLDSEEFKGRLVQHLRQLTDLIPAHFFKEENILFPMALEVIGESEWLLIKSSMDELGYCYFTPEEAIGERAEAARNVEGQAGDVSFETGFFSIGELEAMLNTLPIDITFVDKNDTVTYFNEPKERLFPRAKAVIGRKVQQCHPEKSIDLIDQILIEFKNGQRDHAEFWVEAGGKKIHIRYFAVRDGSGQYLGCVGIDQDITDIQTLEGEKRLL
jgi:hypothetical protein